MLPPQHMRIRYSDMPTRFTVPIASPAARERVLPPQHLRIRYSDVPTKIRIRFTVPIARPAARQRVLPPQHVRIRYSDPEKHWLRTFPTSAMYLQFFPHSRIEGELPGYCFGISSLMGDGKRLAPAKMDGRLEPHGPFPRNLLGTGGLVTGVVAPGQHCFLIFW